MASLSITMGIFRLNFLQHHRAKSESGFNNDTPPVGWTCWYVKDMNPIRCSLGVISNINEL